MVNTIYISDEGCNSGGTISYEIVSGYKPSQHGIPTARTNGDSNRYPDLWKKLRFEFREATATSFYLYAFLPNWGCGAGAMHNFYFDIKFSPNNYPNSYSSPEMISDAYDSSTYTAMSISNVQEDLTMAFQHFSLTFLPITAESSYSTSYTVNHAPYADSEACSAGDMKFQNCIYFHAANEVTFFRFFALPVPLFFLLLSASVAAAPQTALLLLGIPRWREASLQHLRPSSQSIPVPQG